MLTLFELSLLQFVHQKPQVRAWDCSHWPYVPEHDRHGFPRLIFVGLDFSENSVLKVCAVLNQLQEVVLRDNSNNGAVDGEDGTSSFEFCH